MPNHIYSEYSLDNGTTVIIKFNYEKNVNERLNIGGLQELENICGLNVTRRDLKPRHINHKQYGKIIFKTHEEYEAYVFNTNNKGIIAKATGEVLNCRMFGLI